MNKKNKLINKYPKIFKNVQLSPQESPMAFGIECGDGWLKLIDDLCKTLQFMTDKNSYPQVVADQVKEKFGGLRFYYHTENSESGDQQFNNYEYKEGYICGQVDFAENESYNICEQCGTNQDVSTSGGWSKTLCKNCRDKKNK